ncbi:SCO family protein [Nafulsella turpanensis]|uniref:SCO family protein n=1 Tax=Nafulsella turpanensis TaxID=1265690 RepID=UPI000475B3FD|nr:SCO family protein [Nafulsella turpanensis]
MTTKTGAGSLYVIVIFMLIAFSSCQENERRLPIEGPREVLASVSGGADTLYHTIPDFAFVNQDSSIVTQDTFSGGIYVSDFFFTTCPSICPIMKTQMLRVYEKYKGNDQVKILSHSIDPVHDTVAVLKKYANRLGVSSEQWHFVTGDKEKIFELAQKSYMVSVLEDAESPGGVAHSGAFLLIDSKGRIRGHYDGTKAEEVDRLMLDMDVLLKEENLQDVKS